MFKIAQNPSYKWPVTVHIPADGGRFTKATFTAEFKAMAQDDIEAVIQDGRDGDKNADICRECLIGWGAVQDDDGNDLPYSDEAKLKLLNIPCVRQALMNAFFESISGGGAKRKN